MTETKVTDLAQYRAACAAPVTDACRWSEAVESITASNLKLAFAVQRTWLRAIWGV